jgi:mono/diheme cytochrome c family protein
MRKILLVAALGLAAGCAWTSGSSDYDETHYDPPSYTTPPPPPDLKPRFGPTVRAAKVPTPLSGGTLLVTRSSYSAVAADPDRDAIHIVSLGEHDAVKHVELRAGDEPGRLVEDAAGRVHVALRRGGAIATIDVERGLLLSRRPVCVAPRGIAYDAEKDLLHVACAEGRIVSLPAAGGEATRTLDVEEDLRDVVVTRRGLLVTRFRSAELLRVDDEGRIASRQVLMAPDARVPRVAAVAWRMIPLAGPKDEDPVGIIHQRARVDSLPARSTAAYYGSTSRDPSSCGGGEAVTTALTRLGGTPQSVQLPMAVLPVDVASSANGRYAVIAAGNAWNDEVKQLYLFRARLDVVPPDGCLPSEDQEPTPRIPGEPSAVAFAGETPLVFTRQPAALHVVVGGRIQRTIALSETSVEDTGHAIFHANSGTGVACASCHAEGGDDGRTWNFGEWRRTPSLLGTLAGTEPYHWRGDVPDVDALVDETFLLRMAGPALEKDERAALRDWLHELPAPAKMRADSDAAAVRGRALFEDAKIGCKTCHAGPKTTSSAGADVGTGGTFQVPSLVGVAWRAPYLHDGCATTLLDRFTTCGGGDRHGRTSALSLEELQDLVAYLQTL